MTLRAWEHYGPRCGQFSFLLSPHAKGKMRLYLIGVVSWLQLQFSVLHLTYPGFKSFHFFQKVFPV